MPAPMGDEGFMPKHKMKSSLIYPELGQTIRLASLCGNQRGRPFFDKQVAMAEETLKRQQAIVGCRTGSPRFILYCRIHGKSLQILVIKEYDRFLI